MRALLIGALSLLLCLDLPAQLSDLERAQIHQRMQEMKDGVVKALAEKRAAEAYQREFEQKLLDFATKFNLYTAEYSAGTNNAKKMRDAVSAFNKWCDFVQCESK